MNANLLLRQIYLEFILSKKSVLRKKYRFITAKDEQLLTIISLAWINGIPVAEVCRKHGISAPTYYQQKSKYAGMSLPELKRVKELEAENAKLKRMYAELALENTAIKDVLSRKLQRRQRNYRQSM